MACSRLRPPVRTGRPDVCSTSPSTSSESSARSRCAVSVSHATSSCARVTGELLRAQHIQQPSADLTVGACVSLGAAPRRWWPPEPGRPPRARAQRAQPAARRPRGAHRRAQLHQRHRKPRRLSIIGQQRGDVGEVAGDCRCGRVGTAVHGPGDHAPHVGVDDGNRLAIGETSDGPSRVGADAGQRQQGVDVDGHHVAVLGGDRDGAFVQALGPPRIAQLAPGAQHVGRAGGGRRRRCRPARHPVAPDRFHPGHRRLLQHELADQDLPGGDAGPPPRQVALRTRRTSAAARPNRSSGSVLGQNVGHAQYESGVRMEGTQGG